ncbi:MAG: hypothetical protein ACTSPB_19345 [Candidatus Thorarchaeota archaeon]
MAANRISTNLVRYLGADVAARQNNGKLVNVVKDGQGSEIVRPADVQRTFDTNLVSASINIAEFDAAQGYLQQRGAEPLAAKTMAVVMVDAARAQGVSVMSLLEGSNTATLSLLEANTYKFINQLRDGTSQLAASKGVDNRTSVRSRYLLA